MAQVPEEDYDLIADVANSGGHRREAREVLLAALSQARSLTAIVNSSLKVRLISSSSAVPQLFVGFDMLLSTINCLSAVLLLFICSSTVHQISSLFINCSSADLLAVHQLFISDSAVHNRLSAAPGLLVKRNISCSTAAPQTFTCCIS